MKKRYGQHFISDRNILQRIVSLARIAPQDTVVEIGPGAGTLTRELAAAAAHVVAIEIDTDLIPRLRESMPANVVIFEGDALQVDLAAIAPAPFHLVGNLPYNVATPLLRQFIAVRAHILDVTVMLQKEVAERVVARPGTPSYGPLSVLVQYYAEAVIGFTVPAGAFTPRPKVDSAMVRLEWRSQVPDHPGFTDFVQRAFSSRRKKLINNLTAMLPSQPRARIAAALAGEGIPPDARAETLTVQQFLRVYNRINADRSDT